MSVLFESREDAARKLVPLLAKFRGKHPVVLAIPRGAVPLGRMLAQALDADLDVVLAHKLGAPANQDLAIGAVDESGWTWLSPYAERLADPTYIETERQAQLDKLHARRALYTPARRGIDLNGRIAIVVDDGLATGATMIAALHAVRSRKPAWLVCAVPVAPPDSLAIVGEHADEVVCASTEDDFFGVAQFYRSFPQIEDEDVARMLA